MSQTRIAGVLGLQCCWLWLARVIGIQAGVNVPVIFAQDVRKVVRRWRAPFSNATQKTPKSRAEKRLGALNIPGARV